MQDDFIRVKAWLHREWLEWHTAPPPEQNAARWGARLAKWRTTALVVLALSFLMRYWISTWGAH